MEGLSHSKHATLRLKIAWQRFRADPWRRSRYRANRATDFENSGPAKKIPVAQLVAQLNQNSNGNDEAYGERVAAADALGTQREREGIPALINALEDENYLCVTAAIALGGMDDPAAVPPLTGVLTDSDRFWVPRGAAAVALGNLAQVAQPALPALTEALGYDTKPDTDSWDARAFEAVYDAIRRTENPGAPSLLTGQGYRFEMWGLY